MGAKTGAYQGRQVGTTKSVETLKYWTNEIRVNHSSINIYTTIRNRHSLKQHHEFSDQSC